MNENNSQNIITSKLPANLHSYTFVLNNKILKSKVPKFMEKIKDPNQNFLGNMNIYIMCPNSLQCLGKFCAEV